MFNKVSYRRGVIEGVVVYTLGRLGSLISPLAFPDWLYVAAPLLFLALQYLVAAVWSTRRIKLTKRERLSKRFLLLGPLLAVICLAVDVLISLVAGMAVNPVGGVQQGPVILRLLTAGTNHLSLLGFSLNEAKTAVFLLAFFTLEVVCTRLAMGGFLRFTMPAGGNRVTL